MSRAQAQISHLGQGDKHRQNNNSVTLFLVLISSSYISRNCFALNRHFNYFIMYIALIWDKIMLLKSVNLTLYLRENYPENLAEISIIPLFIGSYFLLPGHPMDSNI